MISKDQEILKELYEQQKVLITRLKAIRNAIIGLGGEISNDDFDGMLEVEEEVLSIKSLKIPVEFSADLPQINKIAYAINALGGQAYVSDIVEKLIELEGEKFSEDKALFRRKITLLTSYLYRDNRLKVKKDGNKYLYSLKEK